MKKNSVRLTALILALVLSLSLVLTGCGSKSTSLKIAVPNDTTNEARALLLLQENGLIKLPEGATVDDQLSKNDIVENPYNLDIVEMNAELISTVLGDVSYAVINGNFAIAAGLKPGTDALKLEDPNGESGKL